MTYPTGTAAPPTESQRQRIEAALTSRGVLALQIDRITLTPITDLPGFTHRAVITVYGDPDWECYITKEGGVSSMAPVALDDFDEAGR